MKSAWSDTKPLQGTIDVASPENESGYTIQRARSLIMGVYAGKERLVVKIICQ